MMHLAKSWSEAPHFGSAMVGSMLYQQGGAIKWPKRAYLED